MANKERWGLTEEEKNRYIDLLTDRLPALRGALGIRQEELAGCIGQSRQTYGSIERKTHRMAWDTFLALVWFFDNNQATHQMLRDTEVFPLDLVERFNGGVQEITFDLSAATGLPMGELEKTLDEQAMHSIRTLIMLEYARCNNLSGEAVIKAFDGRNFLSAPSAKDVAVIKSLKKLKEGK